jgi:hypothetical protein
MAAVVIRPDAIKKQTVPSAATAVRFIQCRIIVTTGIFDTGRAWSLAL